MKFKKKKHLICPDCKTKLVFCGEGEFYWCKHCKWEIDIFDANVKYQKTTKQTRKFEKLIDKLSSMFKNNIDVMYRHRKWRIEKIEVILKSGNKRKILSTEED